MPDLPKNVENVISAYPRDVKSTFAILRNAVFEEADRLGVGPIEETLKWGEPAYLTTASKSGSTIRIAYSDKTPDACNLYFNCKTDIVDRFKANFPDAYATTSNRCIHVPLGGKEADLPLRVAVSLALTYHRDKKPAQ